MKKFFLGLVLLNSVSAFAETHCGQTWTNIVDKRFYIDSPLDMTSDIEVLIPKEAKIVLKHYKDKLAAGCLVGKFVKLEKVTVFVAVGKK